MYLTLVQAAETADPSTLPTLAQSRLLGRRRGVPAGVAMLIGATGAILSTHALPAWVGYLAGLIAVLLVLSLAAVFESDEESCSSPSAGSADSCCSSCGRWRRAC